MPPPLAIVAVVEGLAADRAIGNGPAAAAGHVAGIERSLDPAPLATVPASRASRPICAKMDGGDRPPPYGVPPWA
jgi:hypothetical protein